MVGYNHQNLVRAKRFPMDEVYTKYAPIAKHFEQYPVELFENRTVYLPCDDWRWSEFANYFNDNFDRLKLNKLICSSYTENGRGKWYVRTRTKTEHGQLHSNGDFRSAECMEFHDQSDWIVTNYPFSLTTEFVTPEYLGGKLFSIIASFSLMSRQAPCKLWAIEPKMNGERVGQDTFKQGGPVSMWVSNATKIGRQAPPKHTEQWNIANKPELIKQITRFGFEPDKYPYVTNENGIRAKMVFLSEAVPIENTEPIWVPTTYISRYYDSDEYRFIGTLNKAYNDDGKPLKMFKRLLIEPNK